MMPPALPAVSPDPREGVTIRYRVQGVDIAYRIHEVPEHWVVPEIPVPEAPWHDLCLEHLKALLVAWVERTAREAFVFRDVVIGLRREKPTNAVCPDVCILEPPPQNAASLDSLRLWEPGHGPPRFWFEAVSRRHPFKDYTTVPDMCGLLGVQELVVFDPLRAGPRAGGGPWLLQVWRRPENSDFVRVYAGKGPAWSEYLGAYLIPNRAERRLEIAGKASGEDAWLTREQAARRSEQDARRSEQDARARIAELEAELARLKADLRDR